MPSCVPPVEAPTPRKLKRRVANPASKSGGDAENDLVCSFRRRAVCGGGKTSAAPARRNVQAAQNASKCPCEAGIKRFPFGYIVGLNFSFEFWISKSAVLISRPKRFVIFLFDYFAQNFYKMEEYKRRSRRAVEPANSKTDVGKVWLGTDEAVRWVYLVFGFFAVFLLMIVLQRSTDAICCGDWDGYYHIRWSAELWNSFKSGHWLPEFKWLPLTVLNPKDYADHHFLFHLLQIPFLWFFEPVMAAKVATVFYGSLAIFSVYWLMFRYKSDYLLLWFFALMTCANPFFYRM